MILILFFTLVLNIVTIVLTYYCLSNLEKKEKLIFIAAGIAIMYVLTSFVYWISTKEVSLKEVSELGQNLITFLFVPINGLVVLPILAKSYSKYKIGSLASDKLRNRVIVLAVILLIILIVECSYFKGIQNGVITLIENNNEVKVQTIEDNSNEISNNTEENMILENEILDDANTMANVISNTVKEVY